MSPVSRNIAVRRNPRRRAFTLIEISIAVGIIAILVGLVLVAGSAAHNWMKKSSARQQMELISRAIDRYSDSWPRWTVGDVVVADKGWPDFIPGRLFPSIGSNAFSQEPEFNVDAYFDVEDGILHQPDIDEVTDGDVGAGAECLFYALTASAGRGPFITDELMSEFISTNSDDFYPSRSGQPQVRRGKFVDPWNLPFRYFWVYRDDEWTIPSGWTWSEHLPKGLVAVDYGAFHGDEIWGYGYINDNHFKQPSGRRKTAVGYVLESAGPDRRYGNIWKPNPTQNEIAAAEDNLIIMSGQAFMP